MLEYGVDESKKNVDIEEVINYSKALLSGGDLLKRIPISTRLIKEMHKILLIGEVRGNSRNPGEFRSIKVVRFKQLHIYHLSHNLFLNI